MPTNDPEYMKNYMRWRRNPDKYNKPLMKKKIYINSNDIKFLKDKIDNLIDLKGISKEDYIRIEIILNEPASTIS